MTLVDLWTISLLLSLTALLIMGGLIIVRHVSGRTQRQVQAKRSQFLPLLLGQASDEELVELRHSSSTILVPLVSELIELVRGDEREQFVATAARAGVTETLRHQLTSGSARSRITAAEVLKSFPDDHCTAALEDALDDADAGVRFAAALALASSDRAPPARILVERLGLGINENSMLIVTLLSEIARSRPHEIRQLVEDTGVPPAVRAAAIEALSGSGDYSLVKVIADLAQAADDAAPELPRYLRALGAFKHPAALPAIRSRLASPTWWVRAAAAESAGLISLADTIPTLCELLDDDDWWVRFRAGEALVRFGPTGRSLLMQVGENGSERARHAARSTLAEQAMAA